MHEPGSQPHAGNLAIRKENPCPRFRSNVIRTCPLYCRFPVRRKFSASAAARADHLAQHLLVLDQRAKDFGDEFDTTGWLLPPGRQTAAPRHHHTPPQPPRRSGRTARIRLHDVRHTYATILLDSGVDLKIVSERLGHAASLVASLGARTPPQMISERAFSLVAGTGFEPATSGL
jgi:hypothetical protein